jgi:hypothetical protein
MLELLAHRGVVFVEQSPPAVVAELASLFGGTDDVREDHREKYPLRRRSSHLPRSLAEKRRLLPDRDERPSAVRDPHVCSHQLILWGHGCVSEDIISVRHDGPEEGERVRHDGHDVSGTTAHRGRRCQGRTSQRQDGAALDMRTVSAQPPTGAQ